MLVLYFRYTFSEIHRSSMSEPDDELCNSDDDHGQRPDSDDGYYNLEEESPMSEPDDLPEVWDVDDE